MSKMLSSATSAVRQRTKRAAEHNGSPSQALSRATALDELTRCSGTQFDADVVKRLQRGSGTPDGRD